MCVCCHKVKLNTQHKIFYFQNFQVYNMVLPTIYSLLYEKSPQIFVTNLKLYTHEQEFPLSLATTILLLVSKNLTTLDNSYKYNYDIFFFITGLFHLT